MTPQAALADAEPRAWWHDDAAAGPVTTALRGNAAADLVIVGGGFTGMWAAIAAKRRDPGRDVMLLEADWIGYGASGRNGGFISDSLTHGLAHGRERWPDDLRELVDLGRRNLADLAADLADAGIDAGLRLCGKTVVATTPQQADDLVNAAKLLTEYGEDVTILDADEVRADVASPTYLGGLRVRSGGGLVDPMKLATGLRDWTLRLGVRIHESTPVRSLRSGHLRLDAGEVRARQIALATNAFPPLQVRLRKYIVPVYDHVLVTEPLTPAQWAEIGWNDRQGLTDSGNQFHYYRPTDDGRILWGGYDAIYYYGSAMTAAREQRDASHELLAQQFYDTFPQLAGVRFTHRWAGAIDTSSRFTPYVGLDRSGSIAHALGFTGLGVASSRFASQVMLEMLEGRQGPAVVTQRPVPFPPEPLRYLTITATRTALARQDRTGRRGPWLRMLDRFGVGFNS